MKTVGVRALKNRLSEYLRRARSGEGVLVTDRGQVVAELTPPGHGATDPSLPSGLLALARRNLLVVGHPAGTFVRQTLSDTEIVVASDLTLIECDRVLHRAAALGDLTEAEVADRRAHLASAAAHWRHP